MKLKPKLIDGSTMLPLIDTKNSNELFDVHNQIAKNGESYYSIHSILI